MDGHGQRLATSWANAGKFLRKISIFDATGCQVLMLKCTKFDFRWGSAPQPAGRAYSAPPDFLAALKGPNSKEKREERGKRGEGKRREKLSI